MGKLRTFRHENGRGRQRGRTLREGDGLLGPLRAARYRTEQSVPFAAIFERDPSTTRGEGDRLGSRLPGEAELGFAPRLRPRNGRGAQLPRRPRARPTARLIRGAPAWLLTAALLLAGCMGGSRSLPELFQTETGVIRLPAGEIEVLAELRLPDGAHDLEIVGDPAGTTLRVAAGFEGRAVIRMERASGVTLRGFRIDGNRAALARPAGLPPSDVAFIDFYSGNGIVAADSSSVTVRDVAFTGIAGFAVLAARCQDVLVERVTVTNSGSRNELGRNNTTGGILLEEGCAGFTVRDSVFENILGNGVWTHSMYASPRNRAGLIAGNRFREIARDAIQAGHATEVRVIGNRGERIGYPEDAVDAEGGGTPVAIDTAGNVDRSVYSENHFEEINGKCIDLDGFHHGEVTRNTCINRGAPEDYAFGHYGIVMNNTNPDMESENILIQDNTIDGAKFGGIFVIGRGHRIAGNRLMNLNTAGCNEAASRFGCAHFPNEPDLLQSGIYLGQRAERPAVADGNLVEGNTISGHRMAERCIGWWVNVCRYSGGRRGAWGSPGLWPPAAPRSGPTTARMEASSGGWQQRANAGGLERARP